MFNEELKNARIIARLTKPAAAELIGCPLRTYENWESGANTPPEYTQLHALRTLRALEPESGLSPVSMPTDAPDLSSLRRNIGEVYDGSCWEPLTGLLWHDAEPFRLWKFENDVEFENETWRVIIIEKHIMAADDLEAVDRAEDVFFEAWTI